MKCTSCGAELAPGDKFCGDCGASRPEVPAPIVQAERPQPPPPPPPVFAAPEPEAAPPGKRSLRTSAVVGCLGLLAVALVVAGLSGDRLAKLISRSQEPTTAAPERTSGVPTSTPFPIPTWRDTSPATGTRTPPPPPTSTPTPSIEPALVFAYCSALDQSPVYVGENQPVTLYWGWVAQSESHVQEYLDTARIRVFLDDEQLTPDTRSEIEYDSESEGYGVDWKANVGVLTPGSHRVDYDVSWSRQISDGWYTYGPGGEYEEHHSYCEIIVGAAPLRTPSPRPSSTTAPTPVPPSPTPTRPAPTAVPPSPTPTRGPVEFDPIVFAQALDAEGYPVMPSMTFPPGTTGVYAIWACRGLYQGLELRNVWYHNGQEYASSSVYWDRTDERGRWFVQLYRPSGQPLPSGNYRLELHIGGRLLQSGTFTIQ